MSEGVMTERQTEFFRVLTAPFPDYDVKTIVNKNGEVKTNRDGCEIKYIDANTLRNRLDSVVGPVGWYATYEDLGRGRKCKLSIRCPDENGGWIWVTKEDGGGFAGMEEKRYVDGQARYEEDSQSDEKSAYSDSFKRACEAWGINRRYWYRGVPDWAIKCRISTPPGENAGTNGHHAPVHHQQQESSQPPPRTSSPAPGSTSNGGAQGNGQTNANLWAIPRAGVAVWAWCSALERHYGLKFNDGMKAVALKLGAGQNFKDWTQAQVDAICLATIKYITTIENYGGEFSSIDCSDWACTKAMEAVKGQGQEKAEDPLHPIKKQIWTLALKLAGMRNPSGTASVQDGVELIAEFCERAEVSTITSLSACRDAKSLTQLHAALKAEDGMIAKVHQTSEGIPY